MPVSPRKNVSYNSNVNKGVQARDIDIANVRLDTDALSFSRATESSEWPADTWGYRAGVAGVGEVSGRRDGAMAAGDASSAPTPLTPASTDQSVSYVQVVVQKHRRSGARCPTASSPMRAEVGHPTLPVAAVESSAVPAAVLLACPAFAALHQQPSWEKACGLLQAGSHGMQAAAADAHNTASQDKVKQSGLNNEKVKHQYFWKKVHYSYKNDADDYDDGPDCMEVYEFDHGCEALVARGAGPVSYVERGARRASRPAAALLSEMLAVPRLALAAPVHIVLQLQRCVLLGVRDAVTGVVQTTADALLKPLLALAFNAVLRPPLVCVSQLAQALREALRPLALAMSDALEPLAKLLASVRLVQIDRHCRDTVRFLFELFCEVSPGDNMRDPYIVRKYPDSYKNEEELKNVPKFTFPCQLENTFVQHYSFVMTSVDSKYTFCFCRYDPKTNTALVLLSHLPWHDIFYKLLNCIANLQSGPERGELSSFLGACRTRPPQPGHTLEVAYDAGRGVFSCRSPGGGLPGIPENCNLTEYFSALEAGRMAALWAALLHERRVAVVASKPARLSACVQAANDTLFPMSWQHIFIPILPPHLVDYLLAPMPFLIGVPRSVMETVRLSEMGDVVVLDVDANELRTPFPDLESLPPDVAGSLQKALGDRHALGDAVSRAFLRALVALIGGYRDAIRIEKGQLITFNPEAFVKTRKNMQPFLRKILQSQIFQQFVDERLELLNSGRGFSDEFELECTRQAERAGGGGGGGGTHTLKQQYREWARGVRREGGAFFKTVKDKANPAVQSAVKTVRQGGKNMKSAVKGLKNKMPKTGSRPSSINTTDGSRFSCGSATPVSSDSSRSRSPSPSPSPSPSSSPRAPLTLAPRAPAPPAPLPLDLLTEMESLFPEHRSPLRDGDKAKTLNPPRLPLRPHPPLRYPVVCTRRLVDLSDAPAPPPRALPVSTFTTNITRHDGPADFHTSAVRFTEDNDKVKLKLTLSAHARSPPAPAPAPARPEPRSRPANTRTQESSGSDLIQLEDSPTGLEDFDPLKYRDKSEKQPLKSSTDSALLHEYGLDFGQFGLSEVSSSVAARAPDAWTTFN